LVNDIRLLNNSAILADDSALMLHGSQTVLLAASIAALFVLVDLASRKLVNFFFFHLFHGKRRFLQFFHIFLVFQNIFSDHLFFSLWYFIRKLPVNLSLLFLMFDFLLVNALKFDSREEISIHF
jgi:hypothetical protein